MSTLSNPDDPFTEMPVRVLGSGRCCKQSGLYYHPERAVVEVLRRVSEGQPPYPNCPYHHAVTLLGADVRNAASRLLSCALAAESFHGLGGPVRVKLPSEPLWLWRGIETLAGARIVRILRCTDGTCVIRLDTTGWSRASQTPSHLRTGNGSQPKRLYLNL